MMKRTAKPSESEPVLLRIRDAAAMLAVSERSVWQLIRAVQLRAIHPPGMRAIRIAKREVENLVERWQNHHGPEIDQHP
jgi:excisionase family DNA binding protein